MHLIEPPPTLLPGSSLFLDFDGTVVELTSEPDAVVVDQDLLNLLAGLQERLDGRIALLSGRSASDVRGRIHPVQLTIGGSHGLEQMSPADDYDPPRPPAGLDRVIHSLRQLEQNHPGVLIEEKPASVAIHYRLAPLAEAVCQQAAEQASAAIGMRLQQGKMVVELLPAGVDKGRALQRFMSGQPFAGTRPLFIGDDLTDEHGFVAAREFGGAGVLVGPDRPTAATYRLQDVSAVRQWLKMASGMMA